MQKRDWQKANTQRKAQTMKRFCVSRSWNFIAKARDLYQIDLAPASKERKRES